MNFLNALFSEGSIVIEKAIIKNLYAEIGMDLKLEKRKTFTEYVSDAKAHYISMKGTVNEKYNLKEKRLEGSLSTRRMKM